MRLRAGETRDRNRIPRPLARLVRQEGWQPGAPDGAATTGDAADRLAVVDREGRHWWVTWTEATDPVLLEARRRRATALARVPHPHLQRVGRVVTGSAGSAVLSEVVPGTDLATLGSAGARWRPGQVVTLVVPLAGALEALHRAGLAHGDVSAANIVVAPDGRPVLVDLLDGAGGRERGTAGAAAPERSDGVVGAPGDVHALAATARRLLTGAGTGSETGTGSANPWLLAASDDALASVLAEAMHPDPASRLSAAALAAAVWACATPEPLTPPPEDRLVAAALRRECAVQTTRAGTAGPGSRRAAPRHRARPRLGLTRVGPGRSLAAGRMTGRSTAAGRTTGRRMAGRGVAGLAVACLAVVGLAGAVLVGAPELAAPPVPQGAAVRVTSSPPRPDPLVAAVALTRERAEAIAAGDRVRLAGVTLPGSGLSRADQARLDELRGADVRPESVSVTLRQPAQLLPSRPWLGEALVRLDAVARADTEDPPDQRPAAGGTPAPSGRGVVLVLRLIDGQWRVSAVQDVP